MKAKKIWANFSVKDVARTRQFYTALGCKPNPISNYPQLASFCFGDDDFVIHFFERGSQIDDYLPAGSSNGSEVIFSLSAESEQEVKEWESSVKAAGGAIVQQAGRDKGGYFTLVFADPDGHKFNLLLIEKGM